MALLLPSIITGLNSGLRFKNVETSKTSANVGPGTFQILGSGKFWDFIGPTFSDVQEFLEVRATLDAATRTMPKRIVSHARQKGWKKPDNTELVHRPFEFGNPFVVGRDCLNNEEAKQLFRDYVNRTPELRGRIRRKLKGKDVACRCRLDQACHGDVILEIANSE